MADTDDLIRAIPEEDKHLASALILNAKGLERALDCEVRNLSMSVSVSNTHSMKNARMPAEKALTGMAELIRSAPYAVHMLEAMGVPTGIDIRALCQAVIFLEDKLGRTLPGRMKRVLEFQGMCDSRQEIRNPEDKKDKMKGGENI